jgi:enediyne biosynthesis protein E5
LSGRPGFDPRSALISGLSLCLLLRTNSLPPAGLTAAVAIASKFVLRVGDKHVFNPTNFALAVMMLCTGAVWVSPGQWGNTALFGFLLASAGGLVVNRAAVRRHARLPRELRRAARRPVALARSL